MATIIQMQHRPSAQPERETAKDQKLQVAVGGSDLGKVKNKELAWSKIVEVMQTPKRTDVPMKKYKAWGAQGDVGSKKKLELKKSAGFVFGGWCVDGVRKKANVEHHSFIMLDLDSLSVELYWDIEEGNSALAGIRHVWHTTIGHTEEAPRVRIAIPLSRNVGADEFQALSRLIARQLDAEMKQVDPVSFRAAQMMFRPVVTSDGSFKTGKDDGVIFDVDAFLDKQKFDWRDITLLPRATKEKKEDLERQSKGLKAVDPTTKSGIVGDFCRMWDIEAAMAEFIPEKYVQAENGRYTYAEGHGHSGAVIYDEGKFLYSNHGSDPCSDQNVNSFDMVRIHLFGHLDKGADETDAGAKDYDTPAKRPSYAALVEHLAENYPQFALARAKNRYVSDEDIDAALAGDDAEEDDDASEEGEQSLGETKYDELGNEIEDKPVKAKKAKVELGGSADWLELLDLNAEGVIKNTAANIVKILQHHPRYAGCISYNQHTSTVVTLHQPKLVSAMGEGTWVIRDKMNGSRWTDDLSASLIIDLSEPVAKRNAASGGLGLKVAEATLEMCIADVARRNSFHPVRDYLRSLKWDGVKRAETVLIDWLGCEDTRYTRAVSALLFLAGVARVFEPGCKFDDMFIIEGPQGCRKSTFVETLGKHWSGNLHINFDDNRKTINSMSGKWVLEFGELKGMRGDRMEEMKDWLAQTYDRARLAYAHHEEDFYRQSIIIGTTNEKAYLYDNSGNRRFYPILCTKTKRDPIDIDGVRLIVDQLWAEAVTWYEEIRAEHPYQPLPLYIRDEEAQDLAEVAQSTRHVDNVDPWLDILREFLEDPAHAAYANGEWPTGLDADADAALNAEEGYLVRRDVTCAREVLMYGLKIPKEKIKRSEQEKIVRMLHQMPGWKYVDKAKRFKSEVGVQKIFVRIGSSFDPDPPKDPAWDL